MKVDDIVEEIEYIIQQNRELKRAADEVWELGRGVNAFKNDIWDAWRSPDSQRLRDASDRLSSMLNHISAELYEIAHDVLACAQEYENENSTEPKTEE